MPSATPATPPLDTSGLGASVNHVGPCGSPGSLRGWCWAFWEFPRNCLQFACNAASSSASRGPSSSLPANPWPGARLPSPSLRKPSCPGPGRAWQLARRTDSPVTPGWRSPEVAADRWRSWPHVDSSVTSESSLRLTLHLLSSCFPEISNDKQSQNRSHMSPNACGSALVMLFQLSLVLNATANTACSSHTHPGPVAGRLSGSSFPEPRGPSRPCPA